MPSDKKRDCAVGYGKPPRHTRFEKGRSGNPKGRPSGAKNLSTLFIEALNETVIIAENGGRRKISKRQAIVKQIVNKAAKGDWRCTKLLLELPQETGSPTEPESSESSFGAADKRTIEQLNARLRGNKRESDD
jgi:Family of unknown function (DUF5681)